MTTGKTVALVIWTFDRKVKSLLFKNMLSRFVKAFLPRSKILESPLDCKEIKMVSPIYWKD